MSPLLRDLGGLLLGAALVAGLVSAVTVHLAKPRSLEDTVPIVAEAFGWPVACCFVQKNGVRCGNDYPVAERAGPTLGKTCRAVEE